jgi:hypothetical protein
MAGILFASASCAGGSQAAKGCICRQARGHPATLAVHIAQAWRGWRLDAVLSTQRAPANADAQNVIR